MIVVGFNATHDGAAILVRDGVVVAAVEEERFSRRKHHNGFPRDALAWVVESQGLTWSDVDAAAFYWNPYRGLARFGAHVVRSLPRSLRYMGVQPGIFGDFVRMPRTLRETFGFRGRFRYVDHHVGHAASAFFPSAFERAAVMTVDGTGEWTTTFLGVGEGDVIRSWREIGYPHSLGKLYEAVTQYLGFRVNSGEGKVMGLAPYGTPRFRAEFERIIRPHGEASFRLDRRYFGFHYGHPIKYSPRLVALLGPAREPESAIDDRHRDVAATLQAITEEHLLRLAAALHRETGADALCLAGGVALNCVANGRLLRESPFERLFVQPAAHDSGAGLGAALIVARDGGDDVRRPMVDARLGAAYSDEACRAALEAASCGPVATPPDLVGHVAERLAAGKIVGWFQGRAEFGPRALGARSILADPRRADMKDTLNARVKHREGFRPFAPAVTREAAAEWFVGCDAPSPFMLRAFAVAPARRASVPGITHVDGSARVQTVDASTSPRFHALLRAFEERSGVPMLINTSFNRRGEPIVETPAQAIDVFEQSAMDVLVLGPFVVEKPGAA